MGNAAVILRPDERAWQASKRNPTSEGPLKWRGRGVRDLGSEKNRRAWRPAELRLPRRVRYPF